jgi:predicted esterase YcpF (UPF0227 family)
MLQTADESLDYKIALETLPKSRHFVQEGGNHAFDGFEDNFDLIASFYAENFSTP